ncbi:predicted protein [Lichtheimia corymbifera JMRC:FSU:9682]|uniref:Uncharacterized protein n=1 Tax=Lichtheimia corymbifera JMRC:FSU:9682 TaxID=1263082 RepID=A0A068RQM8_9FUNG|nr:predicted protein [Lichtheimia corymbifera JMRC:FSU:9682]
MKDLKDDNEPSQPSPPPPDYDEATEEHEQRHTTLIQHHDRPTKKHDTALRRELANIALIPALNAAITVTLVGVLIYVYQSADGQPVAYTLAGMQIQSLISIIMTLVKMCLAGGIGYAVSEYKWVRMQHGGQLSLMDVYDACTRGVGGMIRVITGISIDRVLLPTIFLQLGLIAMGPASQQILTAYNTTICTTEHSDTWLRHTNYHTEDIANWNAEPYDMRGLLGTDVDYFFKYQFDAGAYGWGTLQDLGCPYAATNCTYNNIQVPYLQLNCVPGNFNTTTIVSDLDLSIQTLWNHYNKTQGYGDGYISISRLPNFFYASSMQNRTRYHAYNYTASEPLTASTDQSPYVGKPAFVAVLFNPGIIYNGGSDPSRVVVQECTFDTYMNRSNYHIMARASAVDRLSHELFEIDYSKFGNTSNWINGDYSEEDRLALNMYAMQLGVLDMLATARMDYQSMPFTDYSEYMNTFLSDVAMTISFARPGSQSITQGDVCLDYERSYHLNPAAYYTVSLMLLVPLFWWIATLVVSLRLSGVARGNSQMALLVTGFTAAVREQFKGFSHTDQNVLFSRSRQVHVVFGEIPSQDGRRGHAAFGLKDQVIAPIKRRKPASDS